MRVIIISKGKPLIIEYIEVNMKKGAKPDPILHNNAYT